MKKLFLLLIACVLVTCVSKAQQTEVQLWGDNKPVTFQCHVVSDAGDYGKMTADRQLEFWENDEGGIDMRETAETSYTKAYPRYSCYIYHGKRDGDKIIFDTYEDGDAMEGTADVLPIEKEYAPYELFILNPKQLQWDGITFNKMTMDFSTGQWMCE